MERYRITPGSTVRLADHDPDDTSAFAEGKAAAKARAKDTTKHLEELQELLFAEGRRRVLVVLQAMDTGGKDGVIRHVFDGVNPAGVTVASFKKPTAPELAHDYLWRVHSRVPGNGEITIFNRSQYEDVLVVRVHSLVPEAVWGKRYDQINAFEETLAAEGTTIVKFYLHISKEEQAERLRARVADPTKQWKFNPADLAERDHWDDYVAAYEAVLSRTSTPWAPWYVVPANAKWYRDLVIGTVLIETLAGLGMQYPAPPPGLDAVVIK
jgi:PPK2 family polyphosphate:nucleotide phosphotransferase